MALVAAFALSSIACFALAEDASEQWARVGEQTFHLPTAGEYFYAQAGSRDALGQELEAHRVGGAGTWHVFHFPEGVPKSAERHAQRGPGRRQGVSSLVQLTSGTVLDTSFPAYAVQAGYKNPLSVTGQLQEKSGSAEITGDAVLAYLKEITAFPTRAFSNVAESEKVESFLQKSFKAMGLKTCIHNFMKGHQQIANVVAFKPGNGEGAVTVGAHYDSRPFTGSAPGADDNGSGLAALLAIAKAFTSSKAEPSKSVYFVGFGGEEDGLDGSAAFTSALFGAGLPSECNGLGGSSSFLEGKSMKSRRESHRAIILDEVGWRSPKFKQATLNIEAYDWAGDVMDNVAAASKDLNGNALKLTHSSHPFGSDHMSFLDNKVQAALMINADDEAYPGYHSPSDTIDQVSENYVALIAKASFGGLMRLAGA